MKFNEIQEACWSGYEQKGMKRKGRRQVPNCVPVEEVKTGPEITGKDLLFKAAAMAIRDASHEGVSLDYEQAIRQASKLYGIPYQPSELPRLLAQRAEIDRQLALLKQGKQVARARRQEKRAPTPAGTEEYWKTHALPTDRIKPPTQTLEAVDPFLDNTARELLGLVIIAGGAFAVGTYYTILNKLKKYQGSQIIDALEHKGVTMNRKTYEQVKPVLDQFRQALKDDEGEQAKMLAKRIEQMIVMGKLSALEPQAQDATLAAKERELAEDLKKWFKEKWVRFGPDGKIRGDCARGSEGEGKPKCLPQSKAHALGKKGRASAAAKKRREDPNPERRGPAKNVATRVKEQYTDDDDWYDDEDQDTELRSGDYVRDQMDGEYGEIFRMQGDPYERRVRILDRDGKGWYIEPSRLTRVDPQDPDVQRYFGKRRQRDMDEDINEGLLYSGDTWQDVLYRINVLNDIFGDQKDLAASFEPASQPEWGPFRDRILRSRTVLDTYAKVKQLANMNVPLTDVEIEMLDDVAWDGGGGPVEPAGHWGERDYDWLEDLYAQQFAVVQHLLDQKAQGHRQNKTKSGQTVHEAVTLDRNRVPDYPRDPATVKHRTDTAKAILSDPRSDPDSRRQASTILTALKQIDEKQDACYNKVKSRYKVWPSAYASGALVQCRKKGAANWGNKKK